MQRFFLSPGFSKADKNMFPISERVVAAIGICKPYFKLTILFVLLLSSPVYSQKAKPFTVKDLKVTWQLITNNYLQKPVSISSFSIENKGKSTFPTSGWTIYFNCNREIFKGSATGNVIIKHLNGDIYQLMPDSNFLPIQKGEIRIITFTSGGSILNYTAAPNGLYLVWDINPDKGISFENYIISPITDTTEKYVTPAMTFQKNKSIQEIPANELVKIFPTPMEYNELNGEFVLDANIHITTDPSFMQESEYLAGEISSMIGKKPGILTNTISGKFIMIHKESMADEAYKLKVSNEGIEISAFSGAGVFYAIQSLRSLMPASAWTGGQKEIRIPAVSVKDAPRFGFRSFSLDVARNFQQKNEILKVLDLMALYKLNTLHFHFIDDEGWRIEIPGLPELTKVGANRGHTLDSKLFLPPSYGSGPDTGNFPASGFYSRADFIDILRYATASHISVIPEIESPGHSRAAIRAMDARYDKFMQQGKRAEAEMYLLRDIDDQSKYRSAQLWTDNVMCVALPSTYRFLEKVIDELILMYAEANAPLSTVHLGGDEVPEGTWQKSPACLKLINRDSILHSTDDLWYYFFGKVNRILKDRKLSLSGWEEIAMRKTMLNGKKKYIPNPGFSNEDFRVNVWNNGIGWGSEDLPYRLANAGYKVVLSCVSNQYFDLAYEKSPGEPGAYWCGFVDTDKPFKFIPFNYYTNTTESAEGNPVDSSLFIGKDQLTDFGKSNILGIEGLLWSENVRSPEMLEYMFIPKLFGLAERAWANDPAWATEKGKSTRQRKYEDAWSEFVNVIGKREFPRLDYMNGGFNYRISPVGISVENGEVMANCQFPGLTVRYTTDGSVPTSRSKMYMGPISEKGKISFCAFSSNGRNGRITVIENK
jgi:hexosaminidase